MRRWSFDGLVDACCYRGCVGAGGALGFAFGHSVGHCGAGGGAEKSADEGFGAHFATRLAF